MAYKDLTPGRNPPFEVNALIEIPRGGGSVKYEFDKNSGFIAVDRLRNSSLHYPGHYGLIPATLGDDGDPLDIVVLCADDLAPGVVISTRPIGVLYMQDEHGGDEKVIAVPANSLTDSYKHIQDIGDLPQAEKAKLEYFFVHYKDLDGNGRWSKTNGWGDAAAAHAVIRKAIDNVKGPAPGQNPKPSPAP